jgi:drug/metabolite transporter (DMT)-like permease
MALIWGVNYSVVKYGTTLVQPLAYNGFRVTLAAVVLLAIVFALRLPSPDRRTIGALLGLGVLGNGVYQYAFIEGIARTRASDAALVVAASPAFIAIIGAMRGVERVSRRGVLGILLSVSGIGLVVLGSTGGGSGEASLAGDLMVLAGSLAWAIYSVLLKPYTERVGGLVLSAYTMLGGAVSLLLVAIPSIATTPWASLPPMGWGAILYSGIFALVIAYFFWYRGIRVIGPTRSAMFSNMQPIIAVLFAWVVLGETPTMWQDFGAACIMGGLLLTRA